MGIEAGKIYKNRNQEYDFFIAKDKDDELIKGHGINRPFIIFYSDDKVYYLSAKSISKKNRKKTLADKFNVVFKTDLYGEDKEVAINCSVINIMDRKLFESLYVKDDDMNNFQTTPWHYDKIMGTLYRYFDEITYAEASHIDNDTQQLVWKSTLESKLNKLDCLKVIKGYNYLLFESDISRKELLDKPDKFFSLVTSFYERVKFETQEDFDEYVITHQEMESIKYEVHIKNAIKELKQNLEKEKEQHKLLEQEIDFVKKLNYNNSKIQEMNQELKDWKELVEISSHKTNKSNLNKKDDEPDKPKPNQSNKLKM
ncbi:Mbov_0400 family ICE element protein [Mycoplasma mycoides]|uniref:Mbov_0400 family ICE element protein n=1 Tax=Mycoplasma mycoides TaxID=2102 RepID=UPI00223FF9D6|nr:hypothetical protein [Mycoplasma mycoides]QVK06992.1 hypothetical protein I7642_00845 [Mycoplasma mycoides subsp. capri]